MVHTYYPLEYQQSVDMLDHQIPYRCYISTIDNYFNIRLWVTSSKYAVLLFMATLLYLPKPILQMKKYVLGHSDEISFIHEELDKVQNNTCYLYKTSESCCHQ